MTKKKKARSRQTFFKGKKCERRKNLSKFSPFHYRRNTHGHFLFPCFCCPLPKKGGEMMDGSSGEAPKKRGEEEEEKV